MARMNYNRPNKGYEPEPWRKSYDTKTAQVTRPKPVLEHSSQNHTVVFENIKSGPHKGKWSCSTCGKWLAWGSK